MKKFLLLCIMFGASLSAMDWNIDHILEARQKQQYKQQRYQELLDLKVELSILSRAFGESRMLWAKPPCFKGYTSERYLGELTQIVNNIDARHKEWEQKEIDGLDAEAYRIAREKWKELLKPDHREEKNQMIQAIASSD